MLHSSTELCIDQVIGRLSQHNKVFLPIVTNHYQQAPEVTVNIDHSQVAKLCPPLPFQCREDDGSDDRERPPETASRRFHGVLNCFALCLGIKVTDEWMLKLTQTQASTTTTEPALAQFEAYCLAVSNHYQCKIGIVFENVYCKFYGAAAATTGFLIACNLNAYLPLLKLATMDVVHEYIQDKSMCVLMDAKELKKIPVAEVQRHAACLNIELEKTCATKLTKKKKKKDELIEEIQGCVQALYAKYIIAAVP
jgi:hypothetical protein